MPNEHYMRRALDLAALGAGSVSPNPLVGCVIVHQDKIIGEGWHAHYGGAHAEAAAIQSVRPQDQALLSQATLFVTLEPCNHHGKTPPCSDLILRHRIPRVIIANADTNPRVTGNGIRRLQEAGVSVTVGMLAQEGREMNKRFFAYSEKNRPYVILKWAQSPDGYIAGAAGKQIAISNEHSRLLIHKMRAEEDAILIGRKTAALDNPQLTARHWHGKNPTRVVIDASLSLPAHLHIFDGAPTLVYHCAEQAPARQGTAYVRLRRENFIRDLLADLHARQISSLIVEGGADTLRGFMQAQAWDIAYVIAGDKPIGHGVAAPKPQGNLSEETRLGSDRWAIWENNALAL